MASGWSIALRPLMTIKTSPPSGSRRRIAYIATTRETTTIDSVAEDAHLFVIPAAGGGGRELATEQDRRVRDPQWSPDGRSIVYLASDRGTTTIFKTASDGGRVSRFSLFTLNGEMAGAFDPQESSSQPF